MTIIVIVSKLTGIPVTGKVCSFIRSVLIIYLLTISAIAAISNGKCYLPIEERLPPLLLPPETAETSQKLFSVENKKCSKQPFFHNVSLIISYISFHKNLSGSAFCMLSRHFLLCSKQNNHFCTSTCVISDR